MLEKRVFRDVYLVGGPEITDPGDCCIYAVYAHPYIVLIDSGLGRNTEDIIENLKKFNLNPSKLRAVIATHYHADHIGGLFRLKKEFNVEIIAHELDSREIEEADEKRTAATYYHVKIRPCKVDKKIKASQEAIKIGKKTFNVIHIPGHTPGSIAVYLDVQGKRILFGQDIHGPYLPELGSNPQQAKESLRKLIELKPDILCEGHFGVIEPREEVIKYINHYI